jgi:UDP-glucose 4-epimerase
VLRSENLHTGMPGLLHEGSEEMKGKVLVLGANGFLGSHVSAWLAAKGYRLRLFDLNFQHIMPWRSKYVEMIEGNFMNTSDLAAALDGVEMVLHFVSTTVPTSSIDNVSFEVESNVSACARLLELMAQKGVRFIGLPSSGGTVYGDGEFDHKEEDPLKPSCPYALGKAMAESLVQFYGDYRQVNYQIWRISNPYGDTTKLHRMQGVIDVFLQKIANDEEISVWGDGSGVRDFIFVDDVAEAIGKLIQLGVKNEVVNIGSGEGYSVVEVLKIIREIVGHDFGVSTVNKYVGVSRSVLSIDKIKRLVDWRPNYTLSLGVAEAWRRLKVKNEGAGF